MANSKPEAVEAVEAAKKPVPVVREAAPVRKQTESIYTAAELANSHKAFKTSREIVVVALRLAGKKTATFAEAKTIVEKFKNKEVK